MNPVFVAFIRQCWLEFYKEGVLNICKGRNLRDLNPVTWVAMTMDLRDRFSFLHKFHLEIDVLKWGEIRSCMNKNDDTLGSVRFTHITTQKYLENCCWKWCLISAWGFSLVQIWFVMNVHKWISSSHVSSVNNNSKKIIATISVLSSNYHNLI